jgi:hypothetical protein
MCDFSTLGIKRSAWQVDTEFMKGSEHTALMTEFFASSRTDRGVSLG